MLIDPKVATHVDEKAAPHQEIARLADGSIDYAFYKRRARRLRATELPRILITLYARMTAASRRDRRSAKACTEQVQPPGVEKRGCRDLPTMDGIGFLRANGSVWARP